MKVLHAVNQKSPPPPTPAFLAPPGPVIIRTVKKGSLKGIYRIAPFDDPEKIRYAFRELNRIARAISGATAKPALYGPGRAPANQLGRPLLLPAMVARKRL